MAIASVSCASRDSEPSDIAPVEKCLTISLAGSISSMSSHSSSGSSLNASSPRSVARRAASSSISFEYSSNVSAPPWRTACWSSAIDSGFHMWCSPSRRQA